MSAGFARGELSTSAFQERKESAMLLLGCLLAFGIAFVPRVMLIFSWIFSERWDVVWKGNWFWPLLGIIFLPFTTIMYMLVWTVGGIGGWDWMWIGLGFLLDVMKWMQIYNTRKGVPGYPGGTDFRYAQDYPYGVPAAAPATDYRYASDVGYETPATLPQQPPPAPPPSTPPSAPPPGTPS
jgi:hypothetical protein